MLTKYIKENKDWDIKLPLRLIALGATSNKIMGIALFEIMTRCKIMLPEHLLCAVPGLVQHCCNWSIGQPKEHLREVNLWEVTNIGVRQRQAAWCFHVTTGGRVANRRTNNDNLKWKRISHYENTPIFRNSLKSLERSKQGKCLASLPINICWTGTTAHGGWYALKSTCGNNVSSRLIVIRKTYFLFSLSIIEKTDVHKTTVRR